MQIYWVAGSDQVSFVKMGQQCEMKYHPGGQGESVRCRRRQWEITQSNTVLENLSSQQLWVKLSHQTFIYPLLLCSLSSITTNTLAADYKGQQIFFFRIKGLPEQYEDL